MASLELKVGSGSLYTPLVARLHDQLTALTMFNVGWTRRVATRGCDSWQRLAVGMYQFVPTWYVRHAVPRYLH